MSYGRPYTWGDTRRISDHVAGTRVGRVRERSGQVAAERDVIDVTP